jgi:hypothetical protein
MNVYEEWDMQCPRCGADHAIAVEVKIMGRVRCDGIDIGDGDRKWGSDSIASCAGCYGGCGFSGTVADFEKASVIDKAFHAKIASFFADLTAGKITERFYEKLRKAAHEEMRSSMRLLRLIHDAPDGDYSCDDDEPDEKPF